MKHVLFFWNSEKIFEISGVLVSKILTSVPEICLMEWYMKCNLEPFSVAVYPFRIFLVYVENQRFAQSLTLSSVHFLRLLSLVLKFL